MTMMMSPQLFHVTNVYGVISTSISSITTNFGKVVDQHLISPCGYDEVATTMSRG